MDNRQRIAAIAWYHSLELGDGLRTEGMFDLHPYVDRYGLPSRLDGLRALDVGAFDGFWSFEMERRGAEVVALDLDDESLLDWPPRRRPAAFSEQPRGTGFALARELLGSTVERVVCSIYEATPERLGSFDIVFCGSVLMHLRDQLLALERLAALCSGTLISAEEYDRAAGLVPFPVSRYRADRNASVVFWQPSVRTWKAMLATAGFDEVTEHGRFTMRSPHGFGVRHVVLHAGDSVTAGRRDPC